MGYGSSHYHEAYCNQKIKINTRDHHTSQGEGLDVLGKKTKGLDLT